MPYAFFKAVEETVPRRCGQGLYGWQVADCTVTMTHSGYWARQSSAHGVFDKSMSSTAGDFRGLTPLVLMRALAQAQTRGLRADAPLRARDPRRTPSGRCCPRWRGSARCPEAPALRGATCTLEGAIPAARVYELQQQLPALTRGEGVMESAFDRYEPVRGTIPTRA